VERGLNLEVREGERHAVIGPNGAGKSTLFNLVSGKYEPDQGEILLAAEPPRAIAELRGRIWRRTVTREELPLVERTFPDSAVATYSPGDPDELAGQLLRLVDDPAARQAAVERAAALVADMAWEHDAVAYLALLEHNIRGR